MVSDAVFDQMGIPGLLRAARSAYGNAVTGAFAAAGFDDIPRNGAYVLARVHDNPSPLAWLTAELGVSKQAVSQLLDTMVMRGYLERREDAEDRRRMLISLTARGQAAARASWLAVTGVDAELESRLTATGFGALRAGLKTLAQMGWPDVAENSRADAESGQDRAGPEPGRDRS
jgi:DNA-binding MarR family transcriptional regulator